MKAKKILGILIGLMAFSVVAIVLAIWMVDLNNYKPEISAAVKESTGRDLSIKGDIHFSLYPDLKFSVSDVHLSNAPGMAEPEMFSVSSVSVKLELWPLISRRVALKSFIVREPIVHLGIDEKGNPNWVFETGAQAPPPPPEKTSGAEGGLPIADLTLGEIKIERGLLTCSNAVSGQDIKAKDINLTVALANLSSPFTLKFSMNLNNEPVSMDVSMDSPGKLLEGGQAVVKTQLASKFVTFGYNGGVRQRPVPGLDGVFDLDIPSAGRLAAWLEQPLDASQPDPGPLKVHAVFAVDGTKAELKEASIEGKAIKVHADGVLEGSKAVPDVQARINVVKANINAYLPKSSPSPKTVPGKEQPAGAQTAGWSEEPLDLSPLSKVNADILVTIGSLHYGEVVIKRGRFKVLLNNGVLKAAIEELKLAGGDIKAEFNVDGSGQAVSLDYQASISGVKSRPLLKTFAGNDRLSGKMDFSAKGKARGRNQKEIVESLNGNGQFKFRDGAIHGINIAAKLRKAKSLDFGGKSSRAEKTDFAELSASYTLTNGLLKNRDFKLAAPLLRLDGEGKVPLPPKTVDYKVTARLVASLKGQGGGGALAGLPIPIRATGPWDNVSVGVDWKSVFSKAALDPERLKNMPKALLESGKNLGVDLSVPKLPDLKKIGKVGDVLNQLVKPKSASSGGGTEEEQPQSAPNPINKLKGLFRR